VRTISLPNALVPVHAHSVRKGSTHVRTRPTQGRLRKIASATLLVLLFAMALSWGGWLLSGGHLFWVGSPSMGSVAPLGTLVVTEPLRLDEALHVGQIIVFRPATGNAVVVHRIFGVLPHSRFETKGDLNSIPDPWRVSRSQIIGTPVLLVPAIGWIYKLAPWLIGGAVILLIAATQVTHRARRWIATVGPSLLVALPVLHYRVLVNGEMLTTARSGKETIARLVDTGILPARFRMGALSVHSSPGEPAVMHIPATPNAHPTPIGIAVALPWWGWLLLAAVCLTPFVNSWLYGNSEPVPSHSKRNTKRARARLTSGEGRLECPRSKFDLGLDRTA
jgi:signal peptidase I